MSKEHEAEWRCPYCDGLNDWQDEICQICGDGKRDEVIPSEKTKSSVTAEHPRMQHQSQNQNTYSQEPTKKSAVNQARTEIRKPEPEVRRSETAYAVPSPAEKPKKRKHWGWIPVVVLLFVVGLYVFGVYKAHTLVDDIDFKFLESAPYSSLDDFKSWAVNQGYEVSSSKDGTDFFADYSVDSGKTPWNITVSEGKHGIEIKYQADGQNLKEVYKKFETVAWQRSWECADYIDDLTFLEGIKGKEYPAEQIWCDKKENWYKLILKGKEVTLIREDEAADSQEMIAQVDLDFLKNVPRNEKIQDSGTWLKEQGYSYSVTGKEFSPAYNITLPQSEDWNVLYKGNIEDESFTVIYNAREKDCKDLSALYEGIKARLESEGFTIVCQEARTSGETTDGSSGKFMIWQDSEGNLYDLSWWKSSYHYRDGVNLVREADDADENAVTYDIQNTADQLNIQALVTMPMKSYIMDENWKQKFNHNYGNANFQPMDMSDGDSFSRVYFRYIPSDQKNKKEVLCYLKNEIQNATGHNLELEDVYLDKDGYYYSYKVATEQGCMRIVSGAFPIWVGVWLEGTND